MRKATENQGNTRTFAEYFSPRSKVKDFELQQQHPPPHFMSYHHETPMKPSQVPNRLSQPPPRRVLPLQSPEMCHRDRLGQQWHPPHPLGPIHSAEFTVGGPTNIGTPTNRPYHMPRDRQGPPQHCVQPPGLYGSSHFVPVSQPDLNTSATILQPFSPGIYHNPAPQFMRDLSNHTSSFHMRAEQVAKPKVTFTYSGSKNVTAKSQEPNKVQSNDFGSPIPTVQLHRPPMAVNPRASQEIYLRPVTESEPWSPDNSHWSPQSYQPLQSNHTPERINVSSLPIMHSPVAPYQDQQHKRAPSSERFTPVMDLYGSSQKRHRDFQDSYNNAKKLCPESANSDKAQTPKPTVCTSVSASPSSLMHSSVSDLLPETTDRNLCTDLACGQSKCSELSSTFKPTQSSSLSPKLCLKRKTSRGAKQVYVNSSQNPIVNLNELKSPSRPVEECLRRRTEEIDKRNKSCTLLSPVVLQRDTSSLPHVQLSSQHSGHAGCSASVSTLSRGSHGEKSRKIDISTPKSVSKPNTDPRNCRTAERNKTGRLRRPVVPSYDIAELFTPDPIVSPPHKTAKPKVDGGLNKSPCSGRSGLSSGVNSSSSSVTGSSSHKTPHAVDSKVSSSGASPQILLPTIALERVKLENLMSLCPKNSPSTSLGRQLKEGSVKSDEKHSSLLPNNVTSVTDTAASEKSSASKCHSQSVPLERQASEGGKKQVIEEDPIDVELDLGLSFALDLDSAQSSHSSEEEQLLSLQEMMDRVAKPPETPEKGAFSEPSTPGVRSSQIKIQPLPTSTKPGLYKNSLDQMLKEINTNKKAKEIETQLLTACKEDLLRIAEYEAAEENQEAGISTEQQEFLQRYSLMSNAIREVPPGEVVFNLEKFGQIFNEITLQLRQCMANPQGTAQKTLLWSSPAQLRLHVNIGLFQEAYDCRSPCPTQVTRFLFKMMSVHSDRMLSEKILQALCDIACTAAYQIVKNGSQQFKVWVPSLADVTLVLMNMGVAFITLFPFENLQPSFTEGDLLEDVYIKSDSPSNNKEQTTFPEHNCSNIFKYLSYCMGLCPRAYSDHELLLLLTLVGRVGLDTRLILQSSVELFPLQYKIVNNIRDWDNMLPKICLALTDLTDDHHNMCLLVQLLPDNTRGKQLRRHLSLSMISKLLDGNCTYKPTEKEFQLSMLRPYLPRMQPSTLLRGMTSSRSQKDKEEDMVTLDQQAYYLCYSLLTLANESSNFQFFPAHQKEQLLCLCSELETHVKCDIRESEKCLYRSKVKDLVARIYTKWQMVLQRTRPLHGKLYDYWQPVLVDTLVSSQEEEVEEDDDIHNSDNEEDAAVEENPVMEEDEQEETNEAAESEIVMTAEDSEEEKEDEAEELNMKLDEKMAETGDDPMDDKNETKEACEPAPEDLNQEMPEKETEVQEESPVMDEQTDTDNLELPEADDTKQSCYQTEAAACGSVS